MILWSDVDNDPFKMPDAMHLTHVRLSLAASLCMCRELYRYRQASALIPYLLLVQSSLRLSAGPPLTQNLWILSSKGSAASALSSCDRGATSLSVFLGICDKL